jgi:hypothetical protein
MGVQERQERGLPLAQSDHIVKHDNGGKYC